MTYQHNQPQGHYHGAPGQGAPAQGGYAQQQRAPAPAPADDGLGGIPMQKTNTGLIIAIAVGVLLVGGVIGYSMFGGKKTSSKEVEQLKAKVAGSAEGSQLSAKEQREHLLTTRKALAKFEAEEAERKKAEDAKKAEEEEQKKKAEAAKAAAAAGPAPVTGAAAKKAGSSLDSIGADYASQLGGN
jgi:ABC-type Na+ efflux pump permease subunit